MDITWIKRTAQFVMLSVLLFWQVTVMAASGTLPLAQQPLLTTTQEPPNIMFMIDNSGSMNDPSSSGSSQTRLQVVKQAAINLLNSLSGVRVGLSTFNNNHNGALIRVGMNDIATNLNPMTNAINAITASGGTPLENTELNLGRYFVQGFNNNLTLHPGASNQQVKRAYTVFDNTPNYTFGVTQSSPIQYFCQKSFIILLTDGEPDPDTLPNNGTGLRNYVTCPTSVTSSGLTCGLADVAAAMFDMDLRPDLTDPTGNTKKNNVATYTIGAGNGISAGGQALLNYTAEVGGGVFVQASGASAITQAFLTAASSILAQSVTASSVSFSGSNLTANSSIYIPSYTTTRWSGNLVRFPVNQTGTVGAASWAEASLLNQKSPSSRLIFTYKNDAGVDTPVLFQTLSQLPTAMQSDLNTGTSGTSDGNGQLRLNYLRGDRTNEKSATQPNNLFRQRDSVLGDIVDSSPVYVGVATASWPDTAPFPTASGQRYSDFKNGIAKTRAPTVYAGANDGMLHGFDANTGTEVLGYIPSNLSIAFDTTVNPSPTTSSLITTGLHYYTDPAYQHIFYVDGTPAVQDVYTKSTPLGSPAWRTVLVAGEHAGGKGYFALDVTNPASFTAGNISNLFLWEFTSKNDSGLGYTFSDPQIALMNNGRWAAIFGNGYNATGSDNAQLFILFLDGGLNGTWVKGVDYFVIDTKSGVATQTNSPNGLATPAVVDINGDQVADRVYAGDLNGNIWAFDVSSSDPTQWKVAYGTGSAPLPLYSGISTQSITTQPVVITNPNVPSTTLNAPNLLVLVGAGQFLSANDKSNTSTQAFYGIWDNGVTNNITQSQLVQQTFTTTGGVRVLTNNTVPYTSGTSSQVRYGWFIQFTGGERVISPATVASVRITTSNIFETEILFSTMIPNSAAHCAYGAGGWLMIAKAGTGGQPSASLIDYNNDGQVNTGDLYNGQVISGIQMTAGVPSQPVVHGDYLFIPSSSGTLVKYLIAGTGLPIGRISWQLMSQN